MTRRHPALQLLLSGLSAACVLAAAGALPAAAEIRRPEKAKIVLQADHPSYPAGATAHVAALVSIEPGWHINSHTPSFEFLIPTVLAVTVPPGWTQGAVRYPKASVKSFAFADQPLSVYEGDVEIDAEIAIAPGTKPGSFPVKAKFDYQACNQSQCLPPVTAQASARVVVGLGAATSGGSPGGPSGLFGMLLLAALGGLILNAMPCVLPVVSLKVFGLMRSAAGSRREVASGALATAAGILVSFWALAVAAVVAAAAGAAVGWGVQFQRPGFVTFLAIVVLLFCLNLWGLFEIPLPSWLARLVGSVGSVGSAGSVGPGRRQGHAGHFASGLFASLMATPCSAPFLGTALGFALAQRAPVVLAMFTAAGLGMALPYLLLAAAPGAVRLLPRPGAWMETARGAMGFLLAGSVVWLLYVLAGEVGPERLSAIELGLLAIALFTWMRHRISQGTAERSDRTEMAPGSATAMATTARDTRALRAIRGASLRAAAAFGLAAALAGTLALAAFSAPPSAAGASGGHRPMGAAGDGLSGPAKSRSAGLIAWTAFDPGRAEELAASGRLIFVDVTADWCFTCKVNERWILDTPEVARAFAEHDVLPMRADWTNRNDQIGAFLAAHGRYGIPFYLLYRPGQKPYVFSELPTKGTVVNAVRDAAAAASGASAPVAPVSSPASLNGSSRSS